MTIQQAWFTGTRIGRETSHVMCHSFGKSTDYSEPASFSCGEADTCILQIPTPFKHTHPAGGGGPTARSCAAAAAGGYGPPTGRLHGLAYMQSQIKTNQTLRTFWTLSKELSKNKKPPTRYFFTRACVRAHGVGRAQETTARSPATPPCERPWPYDITVLGIEGTERI